MNQVQKTYVLAKSAYETAFEQKDWELVDKLEDPFLDAEFALFDWMAEKVIAAGMDRKDVEFLRRMANGDKWEKMIDMAMRLNA